MYAGMLGGRPVAVALSSVGRWTYVASFALVVAIASIALFIAVRL